MQDISGNVTGKIQFKIDKASWNNLDKFSKKLTNIKRQMGGLDKTIKVQQVVQQIKTVGDKVAKASVAAKKQEYNGHVAAYQKYQQQMNKMYDQAIREDRRRDNQKIRQAEMFNRQQLRSDLAKDRAAARMSGRGGSTIAGYVGSRNYEARADRYMQTKILQARIAGVNGKGIELLGANFKAAREVNDVTRDYDALKHSMQMATKTAIENARQMRKSAVTFGSVRSELIQLTAAYTAFAGVQSIARDAMELEGMRAAAKVFAGDEAGVAEHMTFIANEAERLGTNLLVSTKEFTKFAVSTKGKVSEQGGRDIFSGISEYATVLQIDQEQFERAFRSVNQMLSKGQLMAEEVRSQMAESLYGSIPILAQAYGFSADQEGEAAFFKAMERGELKATEAQFVAFAKGLSTAARANGALEAVTKKTRAEMNRFFNELTKAKDTIFQSGMNKGLAYMFGTFSDILKDLAPVSKAFGQAFQGALTTVSAAVKVLLSPLNILVDAFGILGFTDKTTGAIWQVVGSGGALYLMARGFQALTIAITGTNIALLTTLRRMAMLATPLFVAEDLYVGAKGGKSALASGGSLSAGNLVGQSWMDRYGVFWGNQRMANGETQLRITFDSEEAKKFVEVTATGVTQKQQATLASETGG